MSTSLPYPGNAVVSPEKSDRTFWWLAILATLANIMLGVMMVAWPDATLNVLAILFGAWLLAHGVIRLYHAVSRGGMDLGERLLAGMVGVLFIVGGVICLRNLFVSLAVVITVVGLSWLINGVIELIAAFRRPGTGGEHVVHAVLGAFSVLGGLVVLVWPELTLVTLVYITGIWLIVLGIVQLALVVQARRAVTA